MKDHLEQFRGIIHEVLKAEGKKGREGWEYKSVVMWTIGKEMIHFP